jgi:glucose-6-phosphate isomerase
MTLPPPVTDLPVWGRLRLHAELLRPVHLRDLFAHDPGRTTRMAAEADGWYLDYAKHRIDAEGVALLLELAAAVDVRGHLAAMAAGERVNVTEDRAVLHTALRAPRDASVVLDGHDVVPDVHAVLDAMAAFSEQVRSGGWRGHTGAPIRTVVNIGIGGSDLGPAMAVEALHAWTDPGRAHRFVSNVDGADVHQALQACDPASTLIVVSSKTFTTLETLTNAHTARAWLVDALGDAAAVARHFVAVSTNHEAVTAFGIDPANMFGFWDWVGGRYSMDSAIGLSLMLAVGAPAFRDMLAGFRSIDQHVLDAPYEQNVPVLMALLGLWYGCFLEEETLAVIPYSHQLRRFPEYLQQLDMESNGKRVDRYGRPVATHTAPVVWGTAGTNGQHAYFQLLHQGTRLVPVDLIGFVNPVVEVGGHHDLLMANCFAQAEALAFGRTEDETRLAGVVGHLVPHRTYPGNQPSSMLLADRLSPYRLGQLVAIYEHKVAAQGVLWGVNSFDQWGVELGKALAGRMAAELVADAEPDLDHDPSTNALVRRYRALRTRG